MITFSLTAGDSMANQPLVFKTIYLNVVKIVHSYSQENHRLAYHRNSHCLLWCIGIMNNDLIQVKCIQNISLDALCYY